MLLEVILDHRESACPQQVSVHQLLCRLHVGTQPDAQQGQVLPRGSEVPPLQEPPPLYAADHLQAYTAQPSVIPPIQSS